MLEEKNAKNITPGRVMVGVSLVPQGFQCGDAACASPTKCQRMALKRLICCIWVKMVCAACSEICSNWYWPMASA